jgi:hypothetical protein
MNIQDQIREAEQRLREREESSRKTYEKIRREFTYKMAPVIEVLERIKREGYYVPTGDDSKQPFDYRYTPGDTRAEFLVFWAHRPGYDHMKGLYRFCIRLDGFDSYILTLRSVKGDSEVMEVECFGAKDCIRKLMDIAVKNGFLLST